jgi:hypothetical protein
VCLQDSAALGKCTHTFNAAPFTAIARMPPSLLGGGMASGGLGAAAPIENLPADNAPQLAAGLFTYARHGR